MRHLKKSTLLVATFALLGITYFMSCRHDDSIEPVKAAAPDFGTDQVKLSGGWTFDKAHSNVTWETAYDGVGAMLTGRFNQFGFYSFAFDADNTDSTYFEGWVRLNTVNTSEPGRDTGCLRTTFGVTGIMVDDAANIAKIKSVKVEKSTTEKAFIISANLTFHGVTKPVTAKLTYTPKSHFNAGEVGTKAVDVMGFTLTYQILAKTDFAIVSTSIADQVNIKSNTQFKYTYQ